jgi:hypothetical protein
MLQRWVIVVLVVLLSAPCGRGQFDVIETSPSSVDFGEVLVGSSNSTAIKINNVSGFLIYVSSIAIAEKGTDFSVDNDGGFRLAAGESTALGISFSPEMPGAQKATVQVEADVVVVGKQEVVEQEDQNRTDGAAPTETETVALTGTGIQPAQIAVSPTSLNFGNVAVGQRRTRRLTVSNEGGADLEVEQVSLEGSNAFRYDGPQSFVLAGGQEEQLKVNFQPAVPERERGILYIYSNDPEQERVDVSLLGTGVVASIAVSSDTLNFSDVRMEETKTLELGLRNDGNTTLTVYGFEVDTTGGFTVDATGSFEIPAGEEARIDVAFTPPAAISYEAVLSIESSAFDQPVVEVILVGRGVAPRIAVSPEGLEFGEVLVDWTTRRSLQVSNQGTADLHLTAAGLIGPDAGHFSLGTLETETIAPGATVSIAVQFRPGAAGTREAGVRLRSDDPDTPEVTIPISGMGAEVENRSPATADDATAAQVAVVVPESISPSQGRLYFREAGRQSYQSSSLERSDNLLTATIPPEYVTLRGVQYYLEFGDREQVITFPARDPESNPLQLRVEVPEATADVEMMPESYRMVSVPLEVEESTLSRLLEDDYGSYNPHEWRLFRWQVGSYVEFPELEGTVSPGMAFWLIDRRGTSFDVEEARSVDASEPYVIELAPGWNQIGNPFAFPVSWRQVRFDGDVQPPVYYDGAEMRYDLNPPLLKPWEGYFVYNSEDQPVTLEIPPVASEASSEEDDRDAIAEVILPGKGYAVALSAHLSDNRGKDTQNWVGFVDKAADSLFQKTLVEAPGVDFSVRLSILQNNKRYARLFEEVKTEGHSWDLELALDTGREQTGSNVQLRLREYGTRSEESQLYLFDRDRDQFLPSEEGNFSVEFRNDASVRHLNLVVGTPSFARAHGDSSSAEPRDFALYQNYPNPFNPHTVITYTLPEPVRVLVEIYDVVGRRVRTLVDQEQRPGRYEIQWDARSDNGRQLSSGVYFYRMRAGPFTTVRKAVLMR